MVNIFFLLDYRTTNRHNTTLLPCGTRTPSFSSLFSPPFMLTTFLFYHHHRQPRGTIQNLDTAHMYIRPPSCLSRRASIDPPTDQPLIQWFFLSLLCVRSRSNLSLLSWTTLHTRSNYLRYTVIAQPPSRRFFPAKCHHYRAHRSSENSFFWRWWAPLQLDRRQVTLVLFLAMSNLGGDPSAHWGYRSFAKEWTDMF